MPADDRLASELSRRGIPFTRTPDAFLIRVGHQPLSIRLENLDRRLASSSDSDVVVSEFLDHVLAVADMPTPTYDLLFWLLQPTQPETPGPAVSRRLIRSLSQVTPDNGLVATVTEKRLESAGLSAAAAEAAGWANLDRALLESSLQVDSVDGAALGMIETEFVSKASFILAPGLRGFVAEQVGWPVLAVAPDRDSLYLWPADRQDLLPKFGTVVSREFVRAPYPLSTEVFRIDDEGPQAIGAFDG